MPVLVSKTANRNQDPRPEPTIGLENLLMRPHFGSLVLCARSEHRFLLNFEHSGPKVMVGREVIPLLRQGGDATLEIRIINRIGQQGKHTGKPFLFHDHAIGVITFRSSDDCVVQARRAEQFTQISLTTSAYLPGSGLTLFNDAEESEF